MHHWQLTFRATPGAEDELERLLGAELVPVLECSGASAIGLAACVNCRGEFTVLAVSNDPAAVAMFEAEAAYVAALEGLTPLLRTPPKRELWRLLPL